MTYGKVPVWNACGAEREMARSRPAPTAYRRLPSTTRRSDARLRCGQPGAEGQPRHHRADAGRTGGSRSARLLRAPARRQVWISEPSWENHRAIFENAGSRSTTIPTTTHHPWREIRCMIDCLRACQPDRSLCCTPAATTRRRRFDARPVAAVIETVNKRALVPLLDIGIRLGDGWMRCRAVRLFAEVRTGVRLQLILENVLPLRRACGRLSVVAGNADQAHAPVADQAPVRSNYSNHHPWRADRRLRSQFAGNARQ